MLELDAGTRAKRLELQRARLALVLSEASKVPYWQIQLPATFDSSRHIDEDNCLAILGRLPITTKQTIRRNFAQLVDPTINPTELRYNASSGTTDRVTIVTDFRKRDFLRASELRSLHQTTGIALAGRTVEIPPDSCNILCGITDPAPEPLGQYLRYVLTNNTVFEAGTWSGLIGRFDRTIIHGKQVLPPLDAAPRDELAAALDSRLEASASARPFAIRGSPQYLLWLGERGFERGIRWPDLRAVLPYGGLVSEQMAKRIRAAFGVDFRDVYGTTELGVMAASCPHGYLHPFEDLLYFEILRNGQPVEEGSLGDLVVTDLVNSAMPVLRYQLGDVASWHSGSCPGGHGAGIFGLGRGPA